VQVVRRSTIRRRDNDVTVEPRETQPVRELLHGWPKERPILDPVNPRLKRYHPHHYAIF